MSVLQITTRDKVTHALRDWRKRKLLPTALSSAELRVINADERRRSVFSARTQNLEYVAEIATVCDSVLAGKINMADGRWQLLKKLKQLGYDPEKGFPDDVEKQSPVERDSLQDLSSHQRLQLVIETNVRMAQGRGMMLAGGTYAARRAYPAWQLVRVYARKVPRGKMLSYEKGIATIVEDPENSWETRWQEAGETVDWVGALKDRLVALKSSPIWAALGEGAGGHTDVLDNPYPPFAFRSGRGWRSVPYKLCVDWGLIQAGWKPTSSPARQASAPLAAAARKARFEQQVNLIFPEAAEREAFFKELYET